MAWVLTTKLFEFTNALLVAYKYEEMRKTQSCVHWNRKFSEIKCSKMLKLMHNLWCRSNFAKRAVLLDSKIALEDFHKCRWLHWRLLSTNKSEFCRFASCGKGRAIIFIEYISHVHVHCNAKNCVFIAAILSELHAPWQMVMQGYVMGLTTHP